jgi:hypothetical protein
MTETDPDRRPPAAGEATSGRAPRRRIIALAAATLTAVTLAVLTPWPRGFQGTPTGDAELMSELAQTLGSKHWQHIAAARVDGDEVTFAGTGADEHTEFEIGSITKTFTAALFADAIDRGEIDADTRLGEVWPDLHGKVAEVSLESIAQQRSGLPSQKPWSGWGEGLSGILANYVRADPYRGDAAAIVAGLRKAEVGKKEPEYSNFGFAVLGQAIAEVTGEDYGELVRTRITEPLGMKETVVPDSPEGLSHGRTSSGLSAAPWVMGRLRARRCDPLDRPRHVDLAAGRTRWNRSRRECCRAPRRFRRRRPHRLGLVHDEDPRAEPHLAQRRYGRLHVVPRLRCTVRAGCHRAQRLRQLGRCRRSADLRHIRRRAGATGRRQTGGSTVMNPEFVSAVIGAIVAAWGAFAALRGAQVGDADGPALGGSARA